MSNFVKLIASNGDVLWLNLDNIVGINVKRCIVYTTGDIILISESMMERLTQILDR